MRGAASLTRALYSPAAKAMVAVLVTLALLMLGSCSAEPHHGQADGGHKAGAASEDRAQSQGTHEASEDGQPGSRASLVPIVHLTSLKEDVSLQEISKTDALAVSQEYQGLAQNLLDRSSFESFDSPEAVVDHVSRNPGAIGLLPWDEVGPRVKVLTVDGKSLLDPDAAEPRDYPLARDGTTTPDRKQLRRIVVGGDIVLDRGQYYMDIQRGRGVDFSLDGGYAAVTGRTPVPSQYSEYGVIHEFTAERRGGSGEMREYLHSADLTLANFENPVIRNAVWHPDAASFTGDLRLMPILQQAGIDGVTLGNNHILDAGASGLEETMGHLDDADIAYAGAGMNLAAARKPMIFDLGGTKVGVLSYQGVPSYDWAWAANASPGTAPLKEELMREDVQRLRPKVDLVVVMPHWGKEYLASPEPWQVTFAHAAVDAGADLIIGDHAHWPKGIEVYKGKSIFYGVGNFLFDQSWSEETSTGIFAEITLYGDRVIQSRPIPFIVLDKAQPNFLLPKEGGNRALRNIFSVSLGPEFEAYKSSR
jgi:poly-gamma-glutamate capsule biosynthesis protein CapA/YwtB (metallophosphatase superfamily)